MVFCGEAVNQCFNGILGIEYMNEKIIISVLSHILRHSLVLIVQAGARLLLSVIRRLMRKSVSSASHLAVFRLPALCLAQ